MLQTRNVTKCLKIPFEYCGNVISDNIMGTAQKIKFSIKDFHSKCNQICSLLKKSLLKKFLLENFIFCAVGIPWKADLCGQ